MDWSNLAKITYRRTYSRVKANGKQETWKDTINRVIYGNLRLANSSELWDNEGDLLEYFMMNRKAMPAGRGLWFSGTGAHTKLGAAATVNCYFLTAHTWTQYVIAQDLLMLGGGVGLSVENRYVSQLPQVKENVKIIHSYTKDADFIIPDSREGWVELTRRILESFFATGKSFSYSTICLREAGELIKGFGGKASGKTPLITYVEQLSKLLQSRAGKKVRSIDAADIMCIIAEMVVSGNVRRSAVMVQGDCFDKHILKAKRWDLSPLPKYRSQANFSVVCSDIEDLHPLFWESYEIGEAIGIINLHNIQNYGRMCDEQEYQPIQGVNPCVTGDTLVLTRQGYKRIEMLVNTPIEVWNGFEWSLVTPKITGTNQEMLKVTFSNGRELVCTKYHGFQIAEGYKGRSSKKEAKDLVIGDKLIKHEFPVLSEGTSVDSKQAYTQGFVSAEGMDDYNYFALYEPKYMCVDRLNIKHNGLKEKKTNVRLNEKCKSKSFVPFEWDLAARLNWLAGLLDGDGCELVEGGMQLASINRKFLSDLQLLLNTLGIASKVTDARPEGLYEMPNGSGGVKDYLCQRIWRICIGSIQMQKLKNLGLRCERHPLNKLSNRDASQFVKVIAIEEAPLSSIVYCFNEPKRHLGCFNGIVTANCSEANLENGEACNLQNIALPRIKDEQEFQLAARLMYRYGKRIAARDIFHIQDINEAVKRNQKIGVSITGCLQSDLFDATVLSMVYGVILDENVNYSKQLNTNLSTKLTTVNPAGTLSKIMDVLPGGHPAYSRFMAQTIRFAFNDPLVEVLRKAGHPIEQAIKLDGTLDPYTVVVYFYIDNGEDTPTADTVSTWEQLDTVIKLQTYWADQSVSATVYYEKEDIPKIKEWLREHLKELKCISFMQKSNHGFKQAPWQVLSEEEYNKAIEGISEIKETSIYEGDLDTQDCESGHCPIK